MVNKFRKCSTKQCINYKKLFKVKDYNAPPIGQNDTTGAFGLANSFTFTTPIKA